MAQIDVEDQALLAGRRRRGGETEGERGLAFGRQRGGDHDDLRRLAGAGELQANLHRAHRLGISRAGLAGRVLMGLGVALELHVRHVGEAGQAERALDLAGAAQAALEALGDQGEQAGDDERAGEADHDDQLLLRESRRGRHRGGRDDPGAGLQAVLLLVQLLEPLQERRVQGAIGFGLPLQLTQLDLRLLALDDARLGLLEAFSKLPLPVAQKPDLALEGVDDVLNLAVDLVREAVLLGVQLDDGLGAAARILQQLSLLAQQGRSAVPAGC